MTRSEKRTFWFRHCEAALAAEQSNANYARAHGLDPKKLYNWLVSYRKAIGTKSNFVKVQPAPKPEGMKASTTNLTISVNGMLMTFDTLPDAQWLADFVAQMDVQS